jgi:hypothetical protein
MDIRLDFIMYFYAEAKPPFTNLQIFCTKQAFHHRQYHAIIRPKISWNRSLY